MDLASKILVPVLPELEFEEETHTYRLRGQEVPSVTQILKYLPTNDYASVPDYILANAAARGTAVHEAIEFYVQYGVEEYEEEYAPYVDAFKTFWDGLGGAVALGNEIPVYYDDTDDESLKELYGLPYAGTLDMLAAVGEEIWLLDFKCTSSVSKGLKKKYALQLEAYSQALRKFGIVVDKKKVVQLLKDGKHRVYEFPSDDAYSWSVFRSLRAVKNF